MSLYLCNAVLHSGVIAAKCNSGYLVEGLEGLKVDYFGLWALFGIGLPEPALRKEGGKDCKDHESWK